MTRSRLRLRLRLLALALAVTAAAGAIVALARSGQSDAEDAISSRYRSARAECAVQRGNPRSVCVAEARADDRNDRAELEGSYAPSPRASHHTQVVAADSEQAVAQARCNGLPAAGSGACGSEARATQLAAHEDARAVLVKAEAVARAQQATEDATAREHAAQAMQQAADARRDAKHAEARLQCDGYAGRLRDKCLVQQKARFAGQP